MNDKMFQAKMRARRRSWAQRLGVEVDEVHPNIGYVLPPDALLPWELARAEGVFKKLLRGDRPRG